MRVGRIGLPSHPWQGRVLPLNHTRRRKINLAQIPKTLKWARGDLNSQGLLHTLLRRTRIPIPPRAQGAPGGIRTPNDGSEDRCDIHFTTRASEASTKYNKNSKTAKIRVE